MGKTTKSKQSNTIKRTPEFDRLAKTTIDRSIDAMSGDLEQYTGNRVSEFSADELAAQERIRQMTGRDFTGQTSSLLDTAIDRFGRAPTSEDLRGFMNPYEDEVTRRTVEDTVKYGNDAMARFRLGMGKSGAWGSSGMTLGQAEIADDTADRIGDLVATSRRDNYNQAYSRYMDQGSNALNTAGVLDGLTRADIGMLDASGLNQRNLEQAKEDFRFSEFDRSRMIGRQDAAGLSQILAAYPTGTFDSTSTTTQKVSDPVGTALGVASMVGGLFTGGATTALGGLGGMLGKSAIGGAVSSAPSIFAGMKDNLSSHGSTGLNSGWLGKVGYQDGGPITEDDGFKFDEMGMSAGEKNLVDTAINNARGKSMEMSDTRRTPTFTDRFESYFENPLTQLGVSILSADSVGEGMSQFVANQKAKKDQAYERQQQEKREALSTMERAMARETQRDQFAQTMGLDYRRLLSSEEQNEFDRLLKKYLLNREGEIESAQIDQRGRISSALQNDQQTHAISMADIMAEHQANRDSTLNLYDTNKDILQDSLNRSRRAKDSLHEIEMLRMQDAMNRKSVQQKVHDDRMSSIFDTLTRLSVSEGPDGEPVINGDVVTNLMNVLRNTDPELAKSFEYVPTRRVGSSVLDEFDRNIYGYQGDYGR